MPIISEFFTSLIRKPLSVLMKTKIVPDRVVDELAIDPQKPIFYVIKTNSFSDKFAIAQACKKLSMPSPYATTILNKQSIPTLLCIENPQPVIFGESSTTNAIEIGEQIFNHHIKDDQLDAQIIPITIVWGREPGTENDNFHTLIRDKESPSWLRKFMIILFSGRANLVRFSRPVSMRILANRHAVSDNASSKLIRIARFHFYRQKLTVTGPKLWDRKQMIARVINSPAVVQALDAHCKVNHTNQADIKNQAQQIVDEIAADYRDNYIRVANRCLHWLWNKLYSGIKVHNAQSVRDLAEQGHEIIYVPCHRSHMDYLLLSYVIFNQGMVPPHIAAGNNLNFGPVGPILRRGGAFFMRRSFKGNRAYSAIFNEYLSQLFAKGYAVEYFTEGGRSRTGQLLPPKIGMLTMTIQAMLRGIDRPISLVPVYMGYEHVMEVNTYLKELKGNQKKSESMLGIFKAMRKLRDYGYGYVNFGQPLSLQSYLNHHVPEWKEHINRNAPPKPTWLPVLCNQLATDMMQRINNSAAINATNLTALVLLATDCHTISANELKQQLAIYVNLQQTVSYSDTLTLPDMTPPQMLEHLIKLKKVEIHRDAFGDLISLNSKESVLMTYYRNNIIHLFAIPSLIATYLTRHGAQSAATIITAITPLYCLFKDEWFLGISHLEDYCQAIIDNLIEQQLLIREDHLIEPVSYQSAEFFQLNLLANVIQNTLQRYAIILNIIDSHTIIEKHDLEQKTLIIGQRLTVRHGINSPEFLDKKVIDSFIQSLSANQFITNHEQKLQSTERLTSLNTAVTSMLNNRIMQSITQIL